MNFRPAMLAAALGLPAACAAQSTAAPAPAPVTCDKPVYLVVTIDKLDRSKTKAYGEGLRASGIVRRHGGEYKAVGPPDLMLEGEWPADRGYVIEEYPCMEQLRAMWFSDEYQKKLKPLREGSGTYTVAVFRKYQPAPRP
jgi:uncharacterized protein (DUF1330 family)